MGRNMVLNRFVEALPEIYLGHGAVRENWMPVDEALARWEDDGGGYPTSRVRLHHG